MTEFTGRCYGGPHNGIIINRDGPNWRAPVLTIPRPVRFRDVWGNEPISMELFKTLTYRVDRWVEAATSKCGTAMFREVTFWVCDGHKLTVMERSRILTDLRWSEWQRREVTETVPFWGMSMPEYEDWLDEDRSWGRREVILATRKHFPLEAKLYVEIVSLLAHGPAIPESLMG